MKNEKGFGLVEVLLIIVIIVFVAVGGWYIWQSNNKPGNNISPAPGQSVETDPYKGWESYTLKYEKFSIKYPSTFKLTDNSAISEASTPGTDRVQFEKSDGLRINIGTGINGVGGACDECHVVLSQEITFLGQKAALNYVARDSTDKVSHIVLTKNSDDWFGLGLDGKNTTSPFDGQALPMSISIGYYGANNNLFDKDLSVMTSSEDVKEAIKVLESASY